MSLHRVDQGQRGTSYPEKTTPRASFLILILFLGTIGSASALASDLGNSLALHPSLPQTTYMGAQYYGSVAVSGGTSPYVFQIVDGSLPLGLVLNPQTGIISGTARVVTSSSFRVRATDVHGSANSLNAQIDVLYPSGINILVSPTAATLLSGQTQQFSVSVVGTTNTAVTWSASAGTISSGGLFTAPSVTTSTSVAITATSAGNGKSATVNLTVNPSGSGNTGISVSISPTNPTVASGQGQQFTATVTGTSNTSVIWSVKGTGTVTSTGWFTAPGVAEADTVTATSQANSTKSASATVTVTVQTQPPPPPPQNGNIWQAIAYPPAVQYPRDFETDPSGNWYIADDTTGFWKATNHDPVNPNWVQINNGIYAAPSCGTNLICAWTIDYDPYHNQLLATTCTHCDQGGPPGVFFWRSSDGGSNWLPVNIPSTINFIASLPSRHGPAFNANGTMGLWGGNWENSTSETHCGLFYSTDGFQSTTTMVTVTTSDSTATCKGNFNVHYNPVTKDFWSSGETNGVYNSPDGKTWNQVSLPTCPYAVPAGSACLAIGNAVAITENNAGTVFVASDPHLWVQSGSASPTYPEWNWSVVNTGYTNGPYSFYHDSATGYMYAGFDTGLGTIKRSTDNGVTWPTWDTGLPAGFGAQTIKYSAYDGRLYIVGQRCGICANPIYRTVNPISTMPPSPPPSGIGVSITPTAAKLNGGATQQFTATVQGTSNTAVTWSSSAGTISSGGMFTAPTVSSSTSLTVTATSVADPTKTSIATVSVTPQGSTALAVITSSLPGAQTSTAYSFGLQASGGASPYQWTLASGSLPQGISLSSTGQLGGTTTQTGQFSFTVKVTDVNNGTASQPLSLSVTTPVSTGPGYDGPAQLPQILMQTAMANTPAPGTVTVVNAGGSLQNALNSANCGDTIELAAGATFSGNVTFPAKACDDLHWIIVRTSAPLTALPPEGTRMQPCYSGVSSLPGRPAFSCPGGVTQALAKIVDPVPSTGNSGPISFAPGANHYRLLGLEITRTPGGPDYRLVAAKTTADHIILDRVWLHGSLSDDNPTAFGLNGMTYAALIDSYANDFHCTAMVGVCTDAKVIGGGTSQTQDGVYKIVDNFLEASGENILFGGGQAAYTPTDIEIRGNHFYKPLIWMKGQPGFVGGASGYPFVVKNHLELKNAQRVLVEGNIFEYTWGGFSQVGFAILLTPKNQSAGTGNICPICAVTDVTIRYNKISHSGTGIAFANATSDNGGVALAGGRYSVHDITIDDVSASKYNGSGGMFQVFNSWPANVLNNLSIDHVTVFPDTTSRFISISNDAPNPPMYGFAMKNSIVGQNRYAIWNATGQASCANSQVPVIELNNCFPSGYTFADNVIIDGTYYFTLTNWPTGNFFPANASGVQFVNFNGGNGGDYHLLPGSPYKNAGTDGKDLGADIDAILAATANAY